MLLEMEHPEGSLLHMLSEKWRQVSATVNRRERNIAEREMELEALRLQYAKNVGALELLEGMILQTGLSSSEGDAEPNLDESIDEDEGREEAAEQARLEGMLVRSASGLPVPMIRRKE